MRYLRNISKNNILFIEIDTRPIGEFEDLDDLAKSLWTQPPSEFESLANFFPEFSYIKSICIGKITEEGFKTYLFDGDEKELLPKFCRALEAIYAKNLNTLLCGYKLKQFIIPYLLKKCIVHRVTPPVLIDVVGKKPWEVLHVDLFEIWQNIGYYGSRISNVLYATGLPIPNGVEHPCNRQESYSKDMLQTITNLMLLMRNEEVIDFSVAEQDEDEIQPAGLLEQLYAQKGEITEEQEERLKELMSTLNKDEKKIADEILKSIKKIKKK